MEGVCVFSGVASTSASSTTWALFEAMIAAITIARDHGFQHVLFLSDSRNVVQVFKKEKAMDWLDTTRLVDLKFLVLHGLFCNVFFVPHVVVGSVWSVAKRATIMPMNQNWFNAVFL